MTTETLTLSAWLLERIAAEEAVALAGAGETTYGAGVYGDNAADEVASMGLSEGAAQAGYDHLANWMPARVLATCKAHRAIVEDHSLMVDVADRNCCSRCVRLHADMDCENELFPCPTLRALASVYADAPGYREEWAV